MTLERRAADGHGYIRVGRISGVYGVQGWVRVYSYTQPRDNILRYAPWYLRQDGHWLARKLIKGRLHGKGIVAALESIDSRELAAQWVDHEIAIHCEQLLPPNPGEYYWADLIGLRVLTEQGVALGQIERLLETGANDVLIVQGERERLIPFLTGLVVKDIDLTQGLLTVDWDPDF